MKITNQLGLPPSLVAAVTWSDRNRAGSDYTITELIQPPRIVALKRKHDAEIEEDASERIWALLGNAGHEVLRRSAKGLGVGIVEERASVELNGFKISGQIDYALTDSHSMVDFKFTSVWAIKEGAKPEWTQQLNCYRWLAAQYGVTVDSLQIIALLRDWSKPESRRDPQYPQAGVQVLTIPLWTLASTEAWITERIRLHEVAKVELPECTDDDVWAKPPKYAVKKRGNQRATKVFDTDFDAANFMATNFKLGQAEIEYRPGERPRCRDYCAVAEFCGQYQAWRTANESNSAPKG